MKEKKIIAILCASAVVAGGGTLPSYAATQTATAVTTNVTSITLEKASSVTNGLSNSRDSDGNWYYYKNGKIATDVTTVAQNKNGWWKINSSGKVDFNFTGIASNKNGTWYIKNGKVDFSYSGDYSYNDITYTVVKGKAAVKHIHNYASVITKEPTCTENGIRTFTCSGCGDTYTEEIAVNAENHTWVEETHWTEDYDTVSTLVDGYGIVDDTLSVVCNGCGEKFVVGQVVCAEGSYDVYYTDFDEAANARFAATVALAEEHQKTCENGEAGLSYVYTTKDHVYTAEGKAATETRWICNTCAFDLCDRMGWDPQDRENDYLSEAKGMLFADPEWYYTSVDDLDTHLKTASHGGGSSEVFAIYEYNQYTGEGYYVTSYVCAECGITR